MKYDNFRLNSEPVYKEGYPCSHAGCFSHITHTCEECGRILGITNLQDLKAKRSVIYKQIKDELLSLPKEELIKQIEENKDKEFTEIFKSFLDMTNEYERRWKNGDY